MKTILIIFLSVNLFALDIEDLDDIKNAKDPVFQVEFLLSEKDFQPYEYGRLNVIRDGYKISKEDGDAIIECYKSLMRSEG